MHAKHFFPLAIILPIGTVAFGLAALFGAPQTAVAPTQTIEAAQGPQARQQDSPLPDKEDFALPDSVFLEVPFTPQAPFAEWDDPRQGYGCEEASSFMAWHWLNNQSLTLQDAREKIIAMSEWELATYGDFHDSSAEDTAKRFRDYFAHDNVVLQYDIELADIKTELAKGNVVIVPVNGTKLNNPYYTPPGPVQHMIVVTGYDETAQEFVANDPGTKRGEGIRYSYENLAESLQDYKTGLHEPIEEVRSAMIVIGPSSL